MSEQNNQNQNTVYWDPNADVVIKGAELAALFQLVDLQEVNASQIPFKTLASIYALGERVKTEIVTRMNNDGLLFSEPIATETVEPQMEVVK